MRVCIKTRNSGKVELKERFTNNLCKSKQTYIFTVMIKHIVLSTSLMYTRIFDLPNIHFVNISSS